MLFAVAVAAIVVPVGFALSLESAAPDVFVPRESMNVVTSTASSAIVAPVLIRGEGDEGPVHPLYDAAKLLFVGTALIGFASVVRKGM
jgi:hypothetical protein